MAKLIDQIRAANSAFMEAFMRGDAAGVAATYTPEARLLPPDSPMLNGIDAIRAFWQGAMNMGIKQAQLDTLDVDSHGDLAYEVGRYTLTVEPPSGQKTTAAGKYLVVWRKHNGSWKLHVDIWNAGS